MTIDPNHIKSIELCLLFACVRKKTNVHRLFKVQREIIAEKTGPVFEVLNREDVQRLHLKEGT